MNTVQELAYALQQHDNYIVTAHHTPDGDALGSMVAVGCILQHLSKSFVLYNSTGVPSYLSALPLCSPLYTELEDVLAHFTPESIIVLDVSEPSRIGSELYELLPSLQSFSIDHHASCPNFANVINIVEPSSAATGCIVAKLAKELGIPYTGLLGEALYLSITEDTGNFRNANTDAFSLAIASEIVGNGLRVEDFVHKYQRQWSTAKMKLWGHLLSSFASCCDGTVILLDISEERIQQYGCTVEDTQGINTFLLGLQGVRIVILMKEVNAQERGIKLSMRSYGVNLIPLAKQFGGGGHKNASGAFIPAVTLNEAKNYLENAIQALNLV